MPELGLGQPVFEPAIFSVDGLPVHHQAQSFLEAQFLGLGGVQLFL